jgi:phosphoenolpyruvate carboxykinase (ATP)
VGVTEPEATFSACFGAAFLVWHPTKYAEMLAEKIHQHNSRVWLVNTGWAGGSYGVGSRFKLKHTRAIIDAILEGTLDQVEFSTDPIFGLHIPNLCPNVPTELLNPVNAWADKDGYHATANKLADMFVNNFKKYSDVASEEIKAAAPRVLV